MLMDRYLLAVWSYRRDADFHMLRRLVPAVLAGVGAGALFLHLASNDSTRRLIGAVLLLLVTITLLQRRAAAEAGPTTPHDTIQVEPTPSPVPRRRPRSPGTYDARGRQQARPPDLRQPRRIHHKVANAGGPVTSMYFLACRYPVKAFLGTTAWFFFLVNLVKLPFSLSAGLVNTTTLSLTAICAPVVVGAALAGRRLAEHMDQRVFEPIIIVLTIVSTLPLLR